MARGRTGRDQASSKRCGPGAYTPTSREQTASRCCTPWWSFCGFLNGAPASITICYLTNPIAFDAIDGKSVHTIFSMISPTIKGHLQLLARLSWALHDPKFKALVARRATADEIVKEAARIEACFPDPGKR
jgi:hypothetical protein